MSAEKIYFDTSSRWLVIFSLRTVRSWRNALITKLQDRRLDEPQGCSSPSCRVGETTSLKFDNQRVYCLSPRWYISTEYHGGILPTEKNFWFVHQSSLAILPAEASSSEGGIWRRKYWILPTTYYDMWPTDLLPLRRKSCCRLLSLLKIHRRQPSLNTRILGPMASTLSLDHRRWRTIGLVLTWWQKRKIMCPTANQPRPLFCVVSLSYMECWRPQMGKC
jgi:hypothetical protein